MGFTAKPGPSRSGGCLKTKCRLSQKAVCDTLVARGHKAHPDQNGAWTDGVFPAAIAVSDDGERIPVSIAYLTPEVRLRPNLRIVTDRRVERLVIEGLRVVGADTVAANETGAGQFSSGCARIMSSCPAAGFIHRRS